METASNPLAPKFTPGSKFEDPGFLSRFTESFAEYMENMLTDPKHSNNILMSALGRDFHLIPENIRKENRKKYDIHSWTGDAFATVCAQYRPLSEEDIERLRRTFFYN